MLAGAAQCPEGPGWKDKSQAVSIDCVGFDMRGTAIGREFGLSWPCRQTSGGRPSDLAAIKSFPTRAFEPEVVHPDMRPLPIGDQDCERRTEHGALTPRASAEYAEYQKLLLRRERRCCTMVWASASRRRWRRRLGPMRVTSGTDTNLKNPVQAVPCGCREKS